MSGTLGISENEKKKGFRNLVSTSMKKSQNQKKGETPMKGLVPWSKQRTEEAKEVPRKDGDTIVSTRSSR